MAGVHISAPATRGKVLLHTSEGDIDVELWSKEAPLACRNFVQLCLEGYYNNTLFHRVISGFIVQGGDPTGTGEGGESIYGSDFKDEVHSRLRFVHRGILAMAQRNNQPNSNGSQFFFTLDRCDWLNDKHTIFGKITGNTIFNLLQIADCETDEKDRPLYPARIISTEVLFNPFDDIAPRDLAALKNNENASSLMENATGADAQRPKKKRANKSLISFGDDNDSDSDGNALSAVSSERRKNKGKVRRGIVAAHDALADPKLSSEAAYSESDRQKLGDDRESNLKALKTSIATVTTGAPSRESAADPQRAAEADEPDGGEDLSFEERMRAKAAAAKKRHGQRKSDTEARRSDAGTSAHQRSSGMEESSRRAKRAASDADESAAGDGERVLSSAERRGHSSSRRREKKASSLSWKKSSDDLRKKAIDQVVDRADYETIADKKRKKYTTHRDIKRRAGGEHDTLAKLASFSAKVSGGEGAKAFSDMVNHDFVCEKDERAGIFSTDDYVAIDPLAAKSTRS